MKSDQVKRQGSMTESAKNIQDVDDPGHHPRGSPSFIFEHTCVRASDVFLFSFLFLLLARRTTNQNAKGAYWCNPCSLPGEYCGSANKIKAKLLAKYQSVIQNNTSIARFQLDLFQTSFGGSISFHLSGDWSFWYVAFPILFERHCIAQALHVRYESCVEGQAIIGFQTVQTREEAYPTHLQRSYSRNARLATTGKLR